MIDATAYHISVPAHTGTLHFSDVLDSSGATFWMQGWIQRRPSGDATCVSAELSRDVLTVTCALLIFFYLGLPLVGCFAGISSLVQLAQVDRQYYHTTCTKHEVYHMCRLDPVHHTRNRNYMMMCWIGGPDYPNVINGGSIHVCSPTRCRKKANKISPSCSCNKTLIDMVSQDKTIL